MVEPALIARIRVSAVTANIEAVRRRCPGTAICAAVKANAYGHGVRIVVPALARAGVDRVAVAHLEEAMELRSIGWTRGILCLGAPLTGWSEADQRERVQVAVAGAISCTISSVEEARRLSAEAQRQHRTALVDVKIDSGMGRMGLLSDRAFEVVVEIAATPGVNVEGVYTHFASSDEADLTFARQQLSTFRSLVAHLRDRNVRVAAFHASNSGAIFNVPEAGLNLVRPGLAVYGYWGGDAAARPADLRPVLRLVSRLIAVRRLPAGHAVGYGCTFRTQRESLIGVVPIGYADGYRRLLSNNAVMTLDAVRDRPRFTVPVVGRVSMDQATVDLTDAGDVRVGDSITIIDDEPTAPNSVESLARQLNTIPYEITCLLGERVRRVAAEDRPASARGLNPE